MQVRKSWHKLIQISRHSIYTMLEMHEVWHCWVVPRSLKKKKRFISALCGSLIDHDGCKPHQDRPLFSLKINIKTSTFHSWDLKISTVCQFAVKFFFLLFQFLWPYSQKKRTHHDKSTRQPSMDMVFLNQKEIPTLVNVFCSVKHASCIIRRI